MTHTQTHTQKHTDPPPHTHQRIHILLYCGLVVAVLVVIKKAQSAFAAVFMFLTSKRDCRILVR